MAWAMIILAVVLAVGGYICFVNLVCYHSPSWKYKLVLPFLTIGFVTLAIWAFQSS